MDWNAKALGRVKEGCKQTKVVCTWGMGAGSMRTMRQDKAKSGLKRDMFQPITSTNDPIFWNHHSFVDLVWENWRLLRQSPAARGTQYPPNNPSCSSAATTVTMLPFFPMVNKDGLSNAYTDNLYSYAPRPTCSAANPSGCGSRWEDFFGFSAKVEFFPKVNRVVHDFVGYGAQLCKNYLEGSDLGNGLPAPDP
ncbi:hypothetical protein NECAME_14268 [Necator americanus]|uniref:Tyrosinase copper-binding domain-containing protein n=1 Tax=Necator americanus TaxID=51031 RepID=W2SRJ6_NECAM|nr:hypothetical protein NECAME_14268 [Necator americanus]ETN71302.1 hypothetical protein NECAME_14268 [Necator americanus]